MWPWLCAWPRVSLFSLLPCIWLDEPDEAPRSFALPGTSRMPWADARPTPAISATVPINIVFMLRFIESSSLLLFRDGSAATLIQEETFKCAIAFRIAAFDSRGAVYG